MSADALLAVARNIVPAHLTTKAGSWKATFGVELRDKTLGIVGLGRIGKAVCERAGAFGMRIVATEPYPDAAFAEAHNVIFLPLPELLAKSDVVSLHAPAEKKKFVLKCIQPTTFIKLSKYMQIAFNDE